MLMPVLLFTLLLFQRFGESKSDEEVALVLGGLDPDLSVQVDAFIPVTGECEEAVKCIPQLPKGIFNAAGIYTGLYQNKEKQ